MTLTVQDQDGKISGTVVFYLQKRDAVGQSWRVEGRDIEAIVEARVEDGRLVFEVRRDSDGTRQRMVVDVAGADELKLRGLTLTRQRD